MGHAPSDVVSLLWLFLQSGKRLFQIRGSQIIFSVGSLFSALPAALLAAWLRGLCTPWALPHSPGAAQSLFPGCLPSVCLLRHPAEAVVPDTMMALWMAREEKRKGPSNVKITESHGGVHVAPTRINEQDVPTESAMQRGQWVQGQGGQKPGTC